LNGATGIVGGAIGGTVGRAGGLRFAENSPWLNSQVAGQLNNNLDITLNTLSSAISRNVIGATTSSLDLSMLNFINQSSAAGGFLLYPNKKNTNMMRSVYQK